MESTLYIYFNKKNRSVWIIASESGSSAFFYKQYPGYFRFSNSFRNLSKEATNSDTVNFKRLYDILIGSNLGSSSTSFNSINRLKPGYFIKLDQDRIEKKEYSSLFSVMSRTLVQENPYEIFFKIFQASVLRRISAKNVGIALSSGKDSSAIAAMASISKPDSLDRLIGYTHIPSFLTNIDASKPKYNEGIVVQRLLERYSDLGWKKVISDKDSLLESLDRTIEIFNEPIYAASNQFWIQQMFKMMLEDDCHQCLLGKVVTTQYPGLLQDIKLILLPS